MSPPVHTAAAYDTASTFRARVGALRAFHWLVLAASLVMTIVASSVTQNLAEEKRRARFDRQARQVQELVVERMQKYEDALWSGVSAIHGLGGDVTYSQWQTFAASMQVERKYPGINGIGVIHILDRDDVDTYLRAQRAFRPDYSIYPDHHEVEVMPISYIEPEASNRAAVGLDVAHETQRYRAARRARDTGMAQITGPIVLAQDAHKKPGFLFYTPFYREPAASVEARRRSIGGLVYAPFVVERLMQGTLERVNRHVALRILDGEMSIYDEHRVEDASYDAHPLYTATLTVPMYGREWTFDLRSDLSFRRASSDTQPLTILFGGLMIDGLLLMLFVGMARSERRAVSYADQVTLALRLQKAHLELANKTLREQSESLEQARSQAEAARHVAEEAARTKATFLATMSHELRTPMNGVVATAELLLDTNHPDEARELTETVIRSGQTLLALINDILDFSKLEAGKVELDPQPTDLRALLSDVVALLAPQIESRRVSVALEVDEAVPRAVCVDSLRLRQIMLNLGANAVKFTHQGGVRISCRATADDDHPHTLQFNVDDDGIGVANPEDLFQEFAQADASTTRRYGGTGLGLSICKRLVSLLGGSIQVESRVGVGSRFSFTLDLEPAELRQAPRWEVWTGGGPTGHALVVDDNPVNRMVAQKVLERAGWTVDLAEDGEGAVQKVMSTGFDMVFMDCQMPNVDGFEATRRIRALLDDPPPIVALTANALPEDREMCLAAGMSDFLTKPVRTEALQRVLSRWRPHSSTCVMPDEPLQPRSW